MNIKLYKDSNNEIYSYPADGSQDHLIGDKISITQQEANKLVTIKFEPQTTEILQRLSYAEKRILEYPPIIDYIDGVVKGDQAQIDRYINACRAVKNKYPKTGNN